MVRRRYGMIGQTKDAIERLVSCGLKRRDFRCRTDFDKVRMSYNANPWISIQTKSGYEVVECNAQKFLDARFDVTLYKSENCTKLSWAAVKNTEYGETPRFKLVDLDENARLLNEYENEQV